MHPVLFSLGGIELRVYGFLTALSFLTAIYFASILSKRVGYKKDEILDLGLVAIVSSVIGARALYVIARWHEEFAGKDFLKIFRVWEGGIVFYGGLIGAVIACLLWMKWKKMNLLKTTDICVPFLALAHAIGRIGCYFNGCCYGIVNYKYGVIFPATDSLPHLPVQLYESFLNFLNFVVLILLFWNKKRRDGDVFFLYFFNYGIIRFVLEFFRGDPERGTILYLSTSMFLSIFIFLTGLIGLIWLRVKSGKNKAF